MAVESPCIDCKKTCNSINLCGSDQFVKLARKGVRCRVRFSKSVLPEYGGDEEADSDTVDSNHPQHKLYETEHGEFQNESEADRRHCKVWLHYSDLLVELWIVKFFRSRSESIKEASIMSPDRFRQISYNFYHFSAP